MDHDGIRPRFHKGKGAFQGILHPLLQNQALNPGTNHEFLRPLRILSGTNLLRKMSDAVLRLLDFRSEERVLLQTGLVLDNHHRYAETLQRTHRVNKVFFNSSGVSVKDNGFRRDLRNILNRTEAGTHIHKFDIRLSFRRGIAKRTDPHRIKLMGGSLLIDLRILNDETRQTVMRLHRVHEAFQLQFSPKPSSSKVRHRKVCPTPLI